MEAEHHDGHQQDPAADPHDAGEDPDQQPGEDRERIAEDQAHGKSSSLPPTTARRTAIATFKLASGIRLIARAPR